MYTDSTILNVTPIMDVSNAANTNYLIVQPTGTITLPFYDIEVWTVDGIDDYDTTFQFYDLREVTFEAVSTIEELDDTHFYADPNNKLASLNSLRNCMEKHELFSQFTFDTSYYDGIPSLAVSCGIYTEQGKLNFYIDSNFVRIRWFDELQSTDSLLLDGDTFVDVSIYEVEDVFFGVPNNITDVNLRQKIISLKKKYYSVMDGDSLKPIPFDINNLIRNFDQRNIVYEQNHNVEYDNHVLDNWICFYVVAKRYNDLHEDIFYISNLNYLIFGGGKQISTTYYDDYIWNIRNLNSSFKWLTPHQERNVVKLPDGMVYQTVTVLIEDPHHNIIGEWEDFHVQLRFYDRNDDFLGVSELAHFNSINFGVLTKFNLVINYPPMLHYADIVMIRQEKVQSQPLRIQLVNGCDDEGKYFCFLNSLGGMDSLCLFDGKSKTDKTTITTYKRNIPIYYDDRTQIQYMYENDIDSEYKVSGIILSDLEYELFLEMVNSRVVFEVSSKKAIILSGFDNEYVYGENIHRVSFKYKYADT